MTFNKFFSAPFAFGISLQGGEKGFPNIFLQPPILPFGEMPIGQRGSHRHINLINQFLVFFFPITFSSNATTAFINKSFIGFFDKTNHYSTVNIFSVKYSENTSIISAVVLLGLFDYFQCFFFWELLR